MYIISWRDHPSIVPIPLTMCSKFGVSLAFVSGVIVCQTKFRHIYIWKFYVLLDATPCCFSEATLSKFLAALGSTKTLLHVQCCHSCLGHWDMSLNVNQVSSTLIRHWISPYF